MHSKLGICCNKREKQPNHDEFFVFIWNRIKLLRKMLKAIYYEIGPDKLLLSRF